jgi:hypothetical protein
MNAPTPTKNAVIAALVAACEAAIRDEYTLAEGIRNTAVCERLEAAVALAAKVSTDEPPITQLLAVCKTVHDDCDALNYHEIRELLAPVMRAAEAPGKDLIVRLSWDGECEIQQYVTIPPGYTVEINGKDYTVKEVTQDGIAAWPFDPDAQAVGGAEALAASLSKKPYNFLPWEAIITLHIC